MPPTTRIPTPATPAGYDDVFDDPKMGWSRWAHTIRVFTLNSGLFYIRPNARTIALMDRITARLMKEKAWDQAVRRPARLQELLGRWSAACSETQARPRPRARSQPRPHPLQVFNEEIWFPSHGDFTGSHIRWAAGLGWAAGWGWGWTGLLLRAAGCR
jgi:hypothetical protein